MKKTILNLGKALKTAELKTIHGGRDTSKGNPGESCSPELCAGRDCFYNARGEITCKLRTEIIVIGYAR